MELENFNIPANKQFSVLMELLAKNLVYTQILEDTILQLVLKDPVKLQEVKEARAIRADEQLAALYKYIFENYGDVGLSEFLDNN